MSKQALIRLRLASSVVFAFIALSAACQQPELTVMTSGGFTAAYRTLIPTFENSSGEKINTVYGPSMGGAADSIPKRLERGETADVVILARPALDELVKEGRVVPSSCVDLAQSYIAMAVRTGSPKPDIRTVQALKRTLLDAKSIAYSGSASGIYLSTELFPRLGVADAIKGRSRRIDGEMVGSVVARGEAQIGFQQLSELLPIRGIEIVGLLPSEVQKVTVFSAGVLTSSRHSTLLRSCSPFSVPPTSHQSLKGPDCGLSMSIKELACNDDCVHLCGSSRNRRAKWF